ncbi:MAG: hypothetical protein NPIRA06_28780 [Nitrospirales bacterium]|nr:MAG: hypothetical protein NPIRA06_28780 [Nitrospirales bacterium]
MGSLTRCGRGICNPPRQLIGKSSNGLAQISELIEIFHLKKTFSKGSSELVSLPGTVAKPEIPDLRGTTEDH